MKTSTYLGCAFFVFICAIINTVLMVITLVKTGAPVFSIATFMWSLPIAVMYIGSVWMALSGYVKHKQNKSIKKYYKEY